MTSFVLVPGACRGSWWFQPLADRLTQRGHRARAVTLVGLDSHDRAERTVPHPLATLVQRSRLDGAWAGVRDRHYVAAVAPDWRERSPFTGVAERLRGDPSWTVHDLPTGHNVLAEGPDALLAVLLPLS